MKIYPWSRHFEQESTLRAKLEPKFTLRAAPNRNTFSAEANSSGEKTALMEETW